MTLIPVEKLREAHERYLQEQAAKSVPAPSALAYPSRSAQQWERCIRQNYKSNSAFRPKLEPLPSTIEDDAIEAIEQEDGDNSTGKTPKVGPNTLCVDCGHKRSDHHVTPEAHTVDGEHAYYCLTAHCSAFTFKDGEHKPCTCPHFRAHETDAPTLTRPRVGDYDRCANPACGHWKIDHCTKAKPGKAARLKPGESAYKILSKADGLTYPCKHFSLTDSACQCTSTSCAATDDGKEFCACEKFISPLLRTRVKAPKSPAKPRAPRKSRSKKTAFATGAGELFSPLAVEATGVRP